MVKNGESYRRRKSVGKGKREEPIDRICRENGKIPLAGGIFIFSPTFAVFSLGANFLCVQLKRGKGKSVFLWTIP